MSLRLNIDSSPENLVCKTTGIVPDDVWIYRNPDIDFEISMSTWIKIIKDFLYPTGEDIIDGDLRAACVHSISKEGEDHSVWLQDKAIVRIGKMDFISATSYILTNSNLVNDDPRTKFMNWLSDQPEPHEPTAKQLYHWVLKLNCEDGWGSDMQCQKNQLKLTPTIPLV